MTPQPQQPLQSTHYNEGITKTVAFVLTCPGYYEKEHNRPAAGVTGIQLETLIKYIKKKEAHLKLFNSDNLYDYRITNASPTPHYNGTRPSVSELYNEENLERLRRELSGFEIIIVMGSLATKAVTKALPNETIISTCHPSQCSINRKGDYNEERLRIVTDEIIDKISKVTPK